MNIEMPYNWDPYPHQKTLWNYLDGEGKRAVAVWHRRSGKDSTAINYTASTAIERTGVYFHMLPTQKQARKVVWDGIDREGRKIIDQAFPKELRKATRTQEMQIELVNGSVWQLCGSDNYDALVGTNPVGVVFSEWSICNPRAWDYIRPILAENGGWALFIYTARGKNHGYTMAEMARTNPSWYYSLLTVDDTVRPNGNPIITQEAIQEERDAGMSEDMIQQEFYCSFDVALPGAYFSKEIAAARADKRICFVPIEPNLQVHTFWDLGISKGNAMVVWFVQAIGKEIRVINCIGKEDSDMPWFIDQINQFQKDNNITYGTHHAPHDINVRDMFTKHTRLETAKEYGIDFIMVDRTTNLNDSIEASRRLLNRCWFDERRCEEGIAALASYHREYDDRNQVFKDTPVHDWSSNYADAFRQMAQAWDDRLALSKPKQLSPTIISTEFSVFD